MPGKKMNARKALAKKRRSDAVKTPLLKKGKAVDWWFVFKLNSAEQKGNPKPKGMTGIFDHPDWRRPTYDNDTRKFSQHFLFASSDDATLQHGKGILGTSLYDPVGDAWSPLTTDGQPTPRTGHALAWTGTDLLVWGGTTGARNGRSGLVGDGAAWNARSRKWTALPSKGAPAARKDAASAWTGRTWILWGGAAETPLGGGATLSPR